MSFYFDKEIETASREKIENAQLARLKNIIEFASAKNPFYKRKFAEHGVSPEEIRSLEEAGILQLRPPE